MPQAPNDLRQFASLVRVVEILRGPEGCPWDKEQSHQTLTRYALEETAELVEALDTDDKAGIQEELGDVLLQVLLHAEISRQAGGFDIHDVMEGIAAKLIRRHPHVFGDVKVKDSAEVLKNWHQIKKEEKADRPLSDGLPAALPALIASQKIGEKTKRHRFDWTDVADVIAKVDEELNELKSALSEKNPERVRSELGDLLFSVAQLARHLELDSEQALRQANRRFERRFVQMQENLRQRGIDPAKASSSEMERSWQAAKLAEEKI